MEYRDLEPWEETRDGDEFYSYVECQWLKLAFYGEHCGDLRCRRPVSASEYIDTITAMAQENGEYDEPVHWPSAPSGAVAFHIKSGEWFYDGHHGWTVETADKSIKYKWSYINDNTKEFDFRPKGVKSEVEWDEKGRIEGEEIEADIERIFDSMETPGTAKDKPAQQSMVETSEKPKLGSLEWFAKGLNGFEPGCNYVFANECGAHFTIERVVGSYSLAEIDAERIRQGLDPNKYRAKGDPVYQGEPAQQEWVVGAVISVSPPSYARSFSGIVIGFDGKKVICRMNNGYPYGNYDGFHPSAISSEPTQAELEADKREKEITSMVNRMAVYGFASRPRMSQAAGALYDAGYRLSQGKE